MGEDLYELGKTLFAKTDVVAVRADLRRRLEEKIELRECIMHDLTTKPAHEPVEFENNSDRRQPSWQRALRQKKNNINLK